jgi:hypothetical protein
MSTQSTKLEQKDRVVYGGVDGMKITIANLMQELPWQEGCFERYVAFRQEGLTYEVGFVGEAPRYTVTYSDYSEAPLEDRQWYGLNAIFSQILADLRSLKPSMPASAPEINVYCVGFSKTL